MDNSVERSEVMQTRSMSIITLILGAWLIIAPYVLSYDKTAAYWNEVITGIIVVVLALVRLMVPRASWASWVNGLAGIWLIISPFFLAYSSATAYWNQIIFGILVAIVAYSNVGSLQHTHMHHPAH
jgi:hypothetical protein